MPITKPNVILVNGKWSTFMYLKYAFLVRKQLCILCVVYEFPCFKGFDSIAQKFFCNTVLCRGNNYTFEVEE
jgi:hypothetical protein